MHWRLTLALLSAATMASPVAAAQDAVPAVAPVLVVQGSPPGLEAVATWSADGRILATLSAITGVVQL